MVSECTQLQDAAFLRQNLCELYHIVTMDMSPSQLGLWADRKRKFCVFVLRSGPFHFDRLAWQRLLRIFGHARPEGDGCLRGDMFLQASDRMLNEDLAARLAFRGLSSGSWYNRLDPAQQVRKLHAERAVLQRFFHFDLKDKDLKRCRQSSSATCTRTRPMPSTSTPSRT